MSSDFEKHADDMADRLAEQAKQIGEAYNLDTVAIVATYEIDGEKWQMVCGGHGNAYARLQSLREVINGEESVSRITIEQRLRGD